MFSETNNKLIDKYIPPSLYFLGMYGFLSAFLNMGLVIYLNDGSKTGRIILGWTETVTYMLANAGLLWAVFKRFPASLWRAVVLLLCAALIFMLFMGIIQAAESLVNQNGSGKLPIMKPHDKTWYQMSDFFVNYTYALGCISIVEAILGGLLAHKLHLDQRTVNSNSDLKDQIPQDIKDALINEENDEEFQWETSLEPTDMKSKSNSPANSFPSKQPLPEDRSEYVAIDDQQCIPFVKSASSVSVNSYFKKL